MRTRITFADDSTTPERQERADQIELIDESLRKSFAGLDLESVTAEVQRSLTDIGVELAPEQLQSYARAIRDRTDHELRLD